MRAPESSRPAISLFRRTEATPNTEMILISDINLNLLNELHTYGSVRNLKDRRSDLYEVRVKR